MHNINQESKIVVNLGAGRTPLASQTGYFVDWREVRVDIPELNPDIAADLRDLKEIENGFADAVWACHVVEHFYWHDLPRVFRSMTRILKDDGFAIIRVPDLAAIAKNIETDILGTVYETESGLSVSAFDMIYGHRYFHPSADQHTDYNYAMTHKVGFTPKLMAELIYSLGINGFVSARGYEVHCVLYKNQIPDFINDPTKAY